MLPATSEIRSELIRLKMEFYFAYLTIGLTTHSGFPFTPQYYPAFIIVIIYLD